MPMGSYLRPVVPSLMALILISFVGLFNHYQQQTINVVPASASEKLFSGGRALNQLQSLLADGQAHPVDSRANRVVETRLTQQLRDLGYQEEIQQAYTCYDYQRAETKAGYSRCANVRNVIVHIPGAQTGKGILLSSHYDSVPAAPGASDAGAAVAALLEIARLLRLENQPRNSITLLFNEGEETGLLGAKAFIEQHPLAKDLQVAINIEARGTTSRSVLFETGEDSGWLIKHYADTTPAPLSSSLFYEIYKILPNDTDLTIFKAHGLQGINFAHADNEPHYHTPLDNLENLDVGSLQHHGDNVWGVLKHIKDINLDEVEPGNMVYTDILGLTLVQWPESWSFPFSLVLLIFLVMLWVLLKRKFELPTQRIILGLVNILIIALLCGLVAYAIQLLVQTISGHQAPWRANSLPLQLGLWSLMLWVPLAWTYCFIRRSQTLIFLISVSLWLVLFSLLTSYWLTGISFLFIIPALISILVLALINLQPKWSLPYLSLVVSTCAAIIFIPVAYFIQVSVGFQFSAVIGILFSFVAVSMLPALSVNHDHRKGLGFSLIAFSFIPLFAIGFASTQEPYSRYKPQPVNLTYLQQDESDAIVAVGAMENWLPESLQNALGETMQGAVLPWSSASQHFVPTQHLNLPTTLVQKLSEEIGASSRKVSLRFQSNLPNSAGLMFVIPADSNLTEIITGETPSDYQNAEVLVGNSYIYQCIGESCQQREFTFVFSDLKAVDFLVADFQFGLPVELSLIADSRGDKAIQRQNGDQTIILSTVSL